MNLNVLLILLLICMQNCKGQTNIRYRSIEKYLHDSSQTTGMVVLQKGKVVFNYGDIKEISYIASCRKSVLAMLYGPFVESGLIHLNETLLDLGIKDIDGLLPLELTATIDHILTARSGVYHKASNEGDATYMAPQRGTVKPGGFWLYNNWDFNVAGYILEQKTGKSIYKLMDSILAKPLHFEDWNMTLQKKFGDSTRSIYPAYHMFLSTRDMAKIGQLMIQHGVWDGKQIISPNWIRKITGTVTTNQEAKKANTAWYDLSYGYYWWIWEKPDQHILHGAYTASGAFGQFITVIPKLDMIIAHKTSYPSTRNTPPEIYFKILDKLIQ